MASISAACSAVKKPSCGSCPDSAACLACSLAARIPGRLAVIHAAFKPVTESTRNDRRDFAFVLMRPPLLHQYWLLLHYDAFVLPAVLLYHMFTCHGKGDGAYCRGKVRMS